MVILDEPFASAPLLDWLQASAHPVLDNAFARKKVDEGRELNLISDAGAEALIAAGARVYTCTENALSWILDHAVNENLTNSIRLFKDKGLMREKLAALNAHFFFKRIGRSDLEEMDPADLPLPVVLKPNVGFCSMGVYVIQDAKDWKDALEDIKANEGIWHKMYPESVIGSEEYLVEGYVEGIEYALDAYYDEKGMPHILNLWRHDFARAEDTSDRLYCSSAQIIEGELDGFQGWLEAVNGIVGAKGFCVHVETRKTPEGDIIPIEFNPLRFAGLGGTDMAYYGCGYRTYETYLEDIPFDVAETYKAHPEDVYSMSLLGSAGSGRFDYDAFESHFSDVLHFDRFDVEKTGSYGFMFLRTPVDDDRERLFMLHADLSEYLI